MRQDIRGNKGEDSRMRSDTPGIDEGIDDQSRTRSTWDKNKKWNRK
jgi:hypothetical protein